VTYSQLTANALLVHNPAELYILSLGAGGGAKCLFTTDRVTCNHGDENITLRNSAIVFGRLHSMFTKGQQAEAAHGRFPKSPKRMEHKIPWS
jgi:hypothetical protein